MPSQKHIRMTPQRKMILEVLNKSHGHPTASEVYQSVRRIAPRISLGTVYRNLDLLSTCGLVRKIEGMGTQKRFDCKLEKHHHIRCMQCGRVDDVEVSSDNQFEETLRQRTKYRITGYRVDLEGICPQCGA